MGNLKIGCTPKEQMTTFFKTQGLGVNNTTNMMDDTDKDHNISIPTYC